MKEPVIKHLRKSRNYEDCIHTPIRLKLTMDPQASGVKEITKQRSIRRNTKSVHQCPASHSSASSTSKQTWPTIVVKLTDPAQGHNVTITMIARINKGMMPDVHACLQEIGIIQPILPAPANFFFAKSKHDSQTRHSILHFSLMPKSDFPGMARIANNYSAQSYEKSETKGSLCKANIKWIETRWRYTAELIEILTDMTHWTISQTTNPPAKSEI